MQRNVKSALVTDVEADIVAENAENDEMALVAEFDAVVHGLLVEDPAEDAYYRAQLAAAAESIPALGILEDALAGADAVADGLLVEDPAEDAYYRAQLAAAAEDIPALRTLADAIAG